MRVPALLVMGLIGLGWAPMVSAGADESSQSGWRGRLGELPLFSGPSGWSVPTDWLIDGSAYKARVYRTDKPAEIALSNGLITRRFRLAPNGATVALDREYDATLRITVPAKGRTWYVVESAEDAD